MLPGFRFLLAAIVLCISILVFGLGAAALLRAAHEEFAQNPSWRATPEPRFAQAEESAKPVLAMLRVEPVATEAKTTDSAPAEPRVAPPETATTALPAPDVDKAPAPRAQETAPPIEATKAEAPPVDSQPSIDAAPPAVANTGIAEIEQAADAAREQPAASQPLLAPTTPAPQSSPAATKIATLGGPPVVVEMETRREAVSEQDREEARKRQRAQRAKERRQLAARRARLAKQLAAQQAAQQAAADPFAQVMQQNPQPQLLQQTQVTQQTQAPQQPVAARKTR